MHRRGTMPAPATGCLPVKIATWNVNSIKARLDNVLNWLGSAAPDVVLLQEITTVEDGFPRLELEALGYQSAVHGQKSYSGVAILSKCGLTHVRAGLDGDGMGEQARYQVGRHSGRERVWRYV